jgi:hypothetical protein
MRRPTATSKTLEDTGQTHIGILSKEFTEETNEVVTRETTVEVVLSTWHFHNQLPDKGLQLRVDIAEDAR